MSEPNGFTPPRPVRELVRQEPPSYPPDPYSPEPPPDPGFLSADHLADPLRSIAVLLRSLTCEQMWRMTGDEGMRKPELEKVFIEWSKAYMEDRPMADVTEKRR